MKWSTIKVVGHDPSLRNWGYAVAEFCLHTEKITILDIGVIQPVLPTGKQIRQNSLDLETATQLSLGALKHSKDAVAAFVEVPVGSQSARSMASYGVCVGVLGALRASGIPFYELTPNEVKMASVGSKTASKQEMIEWALAAHPEAPWPTKNRLGSKEINTGKAEHMADAIAAIYAGIRTNSFRQALSFTTINKE